MPHLGSDGKKSLGKQLLNIESSPLAKEQLPHEKFRGNLQGLNCVNEKSCKEVTCTKTGLTIYIQR